MSAGPLTLGTAGHIDHGKSALITALTGVDPDRLPEERAPRDLDRARLRPADAALRAALSVVDVPGHERYVRTMVAGATGIDLFLMAIAADDGVMPQTRSTPPSCARWPSPWCRGGDQVRSRRPRRRDARGRGTAARRRDRPRVSARTGAGLDALRAALDRAAASVPRRADAGAGAGPAARRPRVHDPRRRHGAHRHALVGRRSPAAIRSGCCPETGGLARARCRSTAAGRQRARRPAGRGQPQRAWPSPRRSAATSSPAPEGELTETYRLDCELSSRREPPRAAIRVQVHHGTRETPARLTWLGGRFWQLRLETPLIAATVTGSSCARSPRRTRSAAGACSTPTPASTARAAICSPASSGCREARPSRTARRAGPAPSAHGRRRGMPAPARRWRRPRSTLEARAARGRLHPAAGHRARRRRPGRAARRRPGGPGRAQPAFPSRRAWPSCARS